ncbi:MAG: hypothetical protein ACRDJ2_09910 [Actinomycetota bacterium]
MATDEQSLGALSHKLSEVLGKEHADTLMRHLPRDEPAAKRDLVDLERRLDRRFEQIDARFEQVARSDQMEARFEQIDARFEQVARSDQMEARFEQTNERMDLRDESLENRLKAAISDLGKELSLQMVAQTRTFIFATVSSMITLAAVVVAAGR